jgi:hypothetical protein
MAFPHNLPMQIIFLYSWLTTIKLLTPAGISSSVLFLLSFILTYVCFYSFVSHTSDVARDIRCDAALAFYRPLVNEPLDVTPASTPAGAVGASR